MNISEQIIDLIRNRRTQIPTLPAVVQQVLMLSGDEDATIADLSAVISRDQAVANKTLRLANSAYFGFAKQVDSIHRAVTLFGFKEIMGMVIGMSVMSAFDRKGTSELIDSRELWKHAFATSITAEAIARRVETDHKALVQLSGLMHDIGKVFFLTFFQDDYEKVVSDASQKQQSLYHSEKAILGVTHSDVAGLLMVHWNFPEALMIPCRFHHHIDSCPPAHQTHAAIIALADHLCLQAEVGQSGSPVVEKKEDLLAILNFSVQDCTDIVAELEHRRSDIENYIGCMQ